MNYWLLGYILGVFGSAIAYLTGFLLLAELPILIVLVGLAITFGRWAVHLNGHLDPKIAGPMRLIFMVTIIFVIKHLGMGGSLSNVLFAKMVLYMAVLASGILIGFHEAPEGRDFDLAILAPLFILPFVFFLIFAKDQIPLKTVTLFNRNVFAGYFILMSAILLGLAGNKPLVGPLMHGLIVATGLVVIGTLGSLAAFLGVVCGTLALQSLSDFSRFRLAAIIVLFGAVPLVLIMVLGGFSLEGGVWDRISFVYQTTLNILSGYDGTLADLDMATAVRFAASGELDMSAFFRVLHWVDIYTVLAEGGTGTLLLGGGTDWVHQRIDSFVFALAAHNEFLRLLVEQGLVLGGVLAGGIVLLGLSLWRSPAFVPMFSTIVFFGSENQLNNFLSTSLIFLVLGLYFGRQRRVQGQGASRRHDQDGPSPAASTTS